MLCAALLALCTLSVPATPAAAHDPIPNVDGPAQILPAAGRIPERLTLTVTGEPASPDFLAGRIDAAVRAAIAPTLVRGSTIRVDAILPAPQQLGRGFLTSFSVPVTIDPSAGTAGVAGATTVDVINAALPDFLPDVLSFKDDPERIIADGVLSRTLVGIGHPTRLYYYHENKGEPRRFCVVLSANGSVSTHVQIIEAAAGPDIDVMGVGHAVTKAFLTLKPLNEGVIAAIAGGRPLIERDSSVGPGDGIVGAIDLRVLDGGPVTATVMAIPTTAEPATYLYAPKLPDDGHARHGTFDLTRFGQRVVAYSAGGPDVAYVYGNRAQTLPNIDAGDTGHDFGDYGAIHRVTFDLDNPAAAAATLYLYEKPLGGDVRSSFVANGTLVDMGCVRVARRYLVARYELPPLATGTLDVLTMTDGGSNYPLEIGVTASPPLATTPALNAADGCFPKPGGPPAAPQPGAGPAGQ